MKESKPYIPISASLALLLMIALVFLGVYVGNGNALNPARRKAEQGFFTLQDLIGKRIDAAGNLLALAERNISDHEATSELASAIEGSKSAHLRGDVLLSDQAVARASKGVMEALEDALSEKDNRLLAGIKINLDSLDRQIAQSKEAYNEGFHDAIDIYENIPTKWLHKNPKEAMIP